MAKVCSVCLVVLVAACQTDYPQVRAYYLERGISHCISGNCMQGFGKEDIGDGFTYEGHFENYVPDGDGRLFRAGALVYAGKWHAGYPVGKDAPVAGKDAGTQSPIAMGFGPKIRDYGDQKGIETAIAVLSTLACATGGGCRSIPGSSGKGRGTPPR